MNKLTFAVKFITAKGNGAKRSKSVILPVFGLALGIMIVLLTLGIMNGMEEEVFSKLQKFYSPAKLEFHSESIAELESVKSFLNKENIRYNLAMFRNAVVKHDEKFRFISIIAVEEFNQYVSGQLEIPDFNEIVNNENSIIIGSELSYMLDLYDGDQCELFSPVDINLVSGSIPKTTLKTNGIFNFDVLNIDINYAIISIDQGKQLFGKTDEEFLLLNREFNRNQLGDFKQNFPDIRYVKWEEEFESLVSAMKLEKLAYSFFGFIVIFISAFNLLSIMSMMVMRKIPQLGILMSMGLTSKRISRIFLFQSGLTVIIGSCLGGIFTFMIYHINERFQIIKSLLSGFPLSSFPLIITWQNSVLVLLGAGAIIMIAGFYPALKVSKLNPVDAIDYIK